MAEISGKCDDRFRALSDILSAQIDRLRSEFGLEDVIVVGDRGMITRVHRRMLSEHGYA